MRSLTVGLIAATGVVVAGLLVAAARRCIDSPEFFKRTNSRLAVPLIVLGAILLGVAIGGPSYKGCERFQIFRPL